MNKYFIFASDARSYLELINVVRELKNQNQQYFFLYNLNPKTLAPHAELDKFNYDTNITEKSDLIKIPNLGFDLHFKPDIVLMTRESWSPEKELIVNFKMLGSLVCCLENSNSWFYNNIKTRLEILSRMRFPSNIIDKHFDHSEWLFDTKKLAGWVNFKSDIVGIPKFDDIYENIDIDYVVDKYNLNVNKKNVLVFGSLEKQMRPNILSEVRYIKNNLSNDFEILYRPHPQEFNKYKEDFYPKFCIDDIKVIDNDLDVKSIAYLSDFHLSMFQGVTHYSLMFDKKVIIPRDNFGVKTEMDIDIFKEKEFEFWSGVFNIKSWDEFKKIIDLDLLEQFIIRYDKWWNDISNSLDIYDRNLNWTLDNKPSENNSKLLKYFDDFNDQKASVRLVDKMKTMVGVI